jgi:endonuclease G
MPKAIRASDVTKAIRSLDSVRREWLRRPGVTAADVGYRIINGQLTSALAVRVHVARKVPPEALDPHELFNESQKPPRQLGSFPVDVLEASYDFDQQPIVAPSVELEALQRNSRFPTLVGGISVGNPRARAGTLGAIVWDRRDCSVNILGNWHILAGTRFAAVGEPIYQPSNWDGGTARDTVALLNRYRLDRDMDAALARLNGTRPFSRDILDLSPITGIEAPRLGMQVTKSGRTTAVTKGIIDGLNFSPTVGGTTFHDQIHILPGPPWPNQPYEVSGPGDSGAVWINPVTNKAVGLHFCSETSDAPQQEYAGANRMEKVAAATGLDFSFRPLVCQDWARAVCARWPWLCEPGLEGAVSRIEGWPASLPGSETVADARLQRDPPQQADEREQLKATLSEIQAALATLMRRLD